MYESQNKLNDSKNDVIIEHEPYEDKIVQKLKTQNLRPEKDAREQPVDFLNLKSQNYRYTIQTNNTKTFTVHLVCVYLFFTLRI